MNGPLNTVPRGLLGLFGLKGPQDGVRTLSSEVRPTLELGSWMADGNAYQFSGRTSSVAAVGTFGLVNAPDPGKAWLVRNALIQSANVGAAEMLRFRICIRRPSAGGDNYIQMGSLGQTDPNDAVGVGVSVSMLNCPLLMLPGDTFGIVVERIATAATIGISLVALVYEFDWQS